MFGQQRFVAIVEVDLISGENMKQIAEWIKKLDKAVPTILVDYPLEQIENKNQVVQKFFRLEIMSN